MFFCCLDSVKANPLQQDTIRDVTYQLYPLGVACRNNDMATIKRLLAGEDEPMAMGNDFYEFDIFYTAIYFDKEDVLKYALARYKDINNRLYSDEYGLTLLTYACMHIPADTRSAFPVISVQSPVSIQCCWQS